MKLHVSGWSDWPGILRPSEWNWVDFHFLRIGFEWSKYRSAFEVFVGVLGLHVEATLSWYAPAAAPPGDAT
jgi:hypothetical protein